MFPFDPLGLLLPHPTDSLIWVVRLLEVTVAWLVRLAELRPQWAVLPRTSLLPPLPADHLPCVWAVTPPPVHSPRRGTFIGCILWCGSHQGDLLAILCAIISNNPFPIHQRRIGEPPGFAVWLCPFQAYNVPPQIQPGPIGPDPDSLFCSAKLLFFHHLPLHKSTLAWPME